MKVFAFPGLGADKRVFEKLNISCELKTIDWVQPKINESIQDYTRRIIEPLDFSEPFCFMGVSFGGMLAVEASKIKTPEKTVLISSVEVASDLPKAYQMAGKIGIVDWIPQALMKPPKFALPFLFGTNEKELLTRIIDETDPGFIKWASSEVTTWNNEKRLDNCFKIVGSSDKLVPAVSGDNTFTIQGGEHFMIVDKAKEISDIIQEILERK